MDINFNKGLKKQTELGNLDKNPGKQAMQSVQQILACTPLEVHVALQHQKGESATVYLKKKKRTTIKFAFLILHAKVCEKTGIQCNVKFCKTTKDLLIHVATCKLGKSCSYTSCVTTNHIIHHWSNCKVNSCFLCVACKKSQNWRKWRKGLPAFISSDKGNTKERPYKSSTWHTKEEDEPRVPPLPREHSISFYENKLEEIKPDLPPICLKKKRKMLLNFAVRILHSKSCKHVEDQCTVKHCKNTKVVLNHMELCKMGKSCASQNCVTANEITSHWSECEISSCLLCAPYKETLPCYNPQKDYFTTSSAKQSMAQNASDTSSTSLHSSNIVSPQESVRMVKIWLAQYNNPEFKAQYGNMDQKFGNHRGKKPPSITLRPCQILAANHQASVLLPDNWQPGNFKAFPIDEIQEWQKSFTSEGRNRVLNVFIEDVCPSSRVPLLLLNGKIQIWVKLALEMERHVYSLARSR